MTTHAELASVEQALDDLRRGRPVLVTDDADRENEADVVLAADTLTEDWMAWTVRHTSGFVCAPMPESWADRLDLPLMVRANADPFRTAYTVSVDAGTGVSTGISAADRTHTIRTLACPGTTATDLIRPGHVLPLRAKDGGVLTRPGHTEAAVDLCRLAGLTPVAAIGELVRDDGAMMRLPDALALAGRHRLRVLTIEDLIAWRQIHDRVQRSVQTRLPTPDGSFTTIGYRDLLTGDEHVALVSPLGCSGSSPLVRLHSECLTGDTFGSRRCDCGEQLTHSLRRIAAEGGVLVYLRGHEGRGVGLLNKLHAYALQDQGLDTVDAQIELGLPVDARDYTAGAAILIDLGLTSVRLLTNNPEKVGALEERTITVTAVEPIDTPPVHSNVGYLRTKRDRLGHALLLDLDTPAEDAFRPTNRPAHLHGWSRR
ncbi:3,4-dihydroxy-2-butanone-4-phosphate synthase [Microlunatus ginsengisoli]|uniref:Multifunctional fusion protein n=1 Tax=Microlunatus ginsengisoli TaxID=363863 RepID=A0ABP6ZSX6_9ACTN